MKHRTFRFQQPVYAMVYCQQLVDKRIQFCVVPWHTGQAVDIQTPMDLAVDDFPPVHWLN